jgi:hypothetical protein
MENISIDKSKWWDYNFMLKGISSWLEYSAEMHKKEGVLVRSDKTSQQMKIAKMLIDRITEDDIYYNDNVVFCGKRGSSYKRILYQKQNDIDYLFDYMKKHLTSWWD